VLKRTARDGCCGVRVTMDDIRGEPAFFLRTNFNPPLLVTKWICPECGRKYAVAFERQQRYWGVYVQQADKDIISVVAKRSQRWIKNKNKGRFIRRLKDGTKVDTGNYSLRLLIYSDSDVEDGEAEEHRMSAPVIPEW